MKPSKARTLPVQIRPLALRIHIEPSLHRGDGSDAMPMIGQGTDDGVEIFALEHFAEVLIHPDASAGLLLDVAGSAKESGLVDSRWIQKNLLELTDNDIKMIDKGLYEDKIREGQLHKVVFE